MSRGIDIAQDDSHVFLRLAEKSYYSPRVFHMAPTVSVCPPLLIHDVRNAPLLESIYGADGYMSTRQGYMMLNNHPIKTFTIVGRVVDQKTLLKREIEFIYLLLDDFSGTELRISTLLLVSEFAQLLGARESLQGCFVRLVGKVKDTNARREVVTITSELVHMGLEEELAHWKRCLEFRDRVLRNPWVHEYDKHADLSPHDAQLTHIQQNHIQPATSVPLRTLYSPPTQPPPVEIIEISSELDSETLEAATEVNKEKPISTVNDFQVTMEIIKALVHLKFQPTKLVYIYNQPRVNFPLNELVRYRLLTSHKEQNPRDLKFQVFHSIRHKLQVDCNLIRVNKKQVVTLNNLKLLYDHLVDVLQRLRKTSVLLSVNNFIRTLKRQFNWVGEGIDTKIINALIDIILGDDRRHFHYNSKRTEWSFAPSS